MAKKQRESGIELLRIYAIMSVIVLHYFNGGIGGGINYVHGTLSNLTAHTFMSLTFCAVDLFVMISGYFLSANSNRKFSKIFFLLFEAAVVRIAVYLANVKLGYSDFSVGKLLECILFIGYFIVFYSIIYIVSPLINTVYKRFGKADCKKALIILFLLFSVISAVEAILASKNILGSTWTDISTVTKEGSFEGYTVVNFFLCYFVGGYLRHFHSEKKKFSKVFICFAVNTVLLIAWSYLNWQSALTYDNPLVIAEAAWLILMFKDFTFKSKIINELATSGFTCYLAHSFFLKFANIEKYASQSWYVLAIHVVITVVAIYLICYVIHKVYSLLTGWFVKLASPAIDKINITFTEKQTDTE